MSTIQLALNKRTYLWDHINIIKKCDDVIVSLMFAFLDEQVWDVFILPCSGAQVFCLLPARQLQQSRMRAWDMATGKQGWQAECSSWHSHKERHSIWLCMPRPENAFFGLNVRDLISVCVCVWGGIGWGARKCVWTRERKRRKRLWQKRELAYWEKIKRLSWGSPPAGQVLLICQVHSGQPYP